MADLLPVLFIDIPFQFDFVAVSRFGSLRDSNDPNCTYEGDNNMLLGQTSNYLLSKFEDMRKGIFAG